MQKKKLVILGAGFAGLYAHLSVCKRAALDLEITIVNKTNYFLFTPLLHEAATGGLAHHQVVESIREIIYRHQARLVVAEVQSIDQKAQTVATSAEVIPYDYLVVATGASTNFFNTPGAAEHSYILKSLLDAIRLRNHFIEMFETASLLSGTEAKRALLSTVIVGGGPTGVELAAEVAELFYDTFEKFYHKEIPKDAIDIHLIHSGSELLSPFAPHARARAARTLACKKVELHLNARVKEVRKGEVLLSDGATIPAGTVVWTAGVSPNTPTFSETVPLDKQGRIIVDHNFRLPQHQNIFALGDVAHFENDDGTILPMLAQIAVAEGKYFGKNFSRLLRGESLLPFHFVSSGELVSLGQWDAVGTIGRLKLYGKLAWFIWRTVYLFKFISRSKKIKIVVDWTLHIFFPRDITRA